ncbi:hypothetical protein HAX54_029834, partial [Datura stramonium]|nr:hypothetical protein [Datura stramonium]
AIYVSGILRGVTCLLGNPMAKEVVIRELNNPSQLIRAITLERSKKKVAIIQPPTALPRGNEELQRKKAKEDKRFE